MVKRSSLDVLKEGNAAFLEKKSLSEPSKKKPPKSKNLVKLLIAPMSLVVFFAAVRMGHHLSSPA